LTSGFAFTDAASERTCFTDIFGSEHEELAGW
jgi:hypothetical protein